MVQRTKTAAKRKLKMETINKKYVPLDNSYLLNLTTEGKEVLLAGSVREDPKETLIVSTPYKEKVETTFNGLKEYKFINVFYEGDVYRVLYFDWRVDYSLEQAIWENELDFEYLK